MESYLNFLPQATIEWLKTSSHCVTLKNSHFSIVSIKYAFHVNAFQVVLSLVRSFGALAAVTVTSMRKGLSVVISFVMFRCVV